MSHIVVFAEAVAPTYRRYSSIRGHVGVLNISEQNWTQAGRAYGARATRWLSSSRGTCETDEVTGDLDAALAVATSQLPWLTRCDSSSAPHRLGEAA